MIKKIISLFVVSLMLLTILSPLVLANNKTINNKKISILPTTSVDDFEGDIKNPAESITQITNVDEILTIYDKNTVIIQESEWYQERLQEMEQEKLQEMNGKNVSKENNNIKNEYHDDIFKNNKYESDEKKKVIIDIESLDDDIEKSKGKENQNQIYKQVYVKASQDFDITTIEGAEIITILDDGYIIEVPVTQINELVQNDEVTKVVDKNSIKDEEKEEQKKIINDYKERNIERKHLEVKPEEIEQAKEDSIIALKKLGYTEEELEITSPYLYYFINNNSIPSTTTIQQAYDESTSIVYLSDTLLWEQNEKWVSPSIVYDITPTMDTNPTTSAVSDCEEHAITFVAMARQQNIPAENVRVTLGYVELGGEKFGHAWAQIKLIDGTWMNVEPTSGSYIENNKLVEHEALGLYYYKDKTYPVVEIWSYFNDKYYVDSSGTVAPEDWIIQSTSYNIGNQMTPSINGYFDDIITWIQQELYIIMN